MVRVRNGERVATVLIDAGGLLTDPVDGGRRRLNQSFWSGQLRDNEAVSDQADFSDDGRGGRHLARQRLFGEVRGNAARDVLIVRRSPAGRAALSLSGTAGSVPTDSHDFQNVV